MDKKFLNKVVDQLVNETRIDYNERRIYFPSFSSPLSLFLSLILSPSRSFISSSFTKHCKNVYGLNDGEIDYVWVEYKKIIKDKIIKKIENKNIIIPEGHVTNIPEDDYLNKVFNMLNHPPYLYKLESMGLSKGEVEKVFKKLFGGGVEVKYKKGKGVYLVHTRYKRKDKVTKVLFKDIKTINHFELEK